MTKKESSLPEDYIQRELETFHKAFAAGNEWGFADALTFCKEHSVQLPSWALDTIRTRHADAYHGAYKRTGNWKRRFQQDMIDFMRAETVQECREHGTPWKVVYEVAARMLEGTDCYGKPDTIKKSYGNFKNTMKTEPWRYYIPHSMPPSMRKRLGFAGIIRTKEYLEWFMKTFPEGRYR